MSTPWNNELCAPIEPSWRSRPRLWGFPSMNARRKRPNHDDLSEAAKLLREILKAMPSEDDRPRDAVVRRRVEGAITAAELAAGEDSPRTSDDPS